MAKKVNEYTVRLSALPAAKTPLIISEEGIIVFPYLPAITRCRADVFEAIQKIVGDKEKSQKVIEVFEAEFPNLLTDYRIKGIPG